MITITETSVRPNNSVTFWTSPSDFSAEYEKLFYATKKIASSKFWYTDELTRIRVTEYTDSSVLLETSNFFSQYANGSVAMSKTTYNQEKGITTSVVVDPPI